MRMGERWWWGVSVRSMSVRSSRSLRAGTQGLGIDAVDFEALRFVEKERCVDASGEPAVEPGGVIGADDEDMLGGRDPVGFVVDHRLIAVEGEAIVHIALDGVGGDQLYVRGVALDLAGEGTGGVVHVKLFAVEAQQEDECCKDRN